MRMTLERLRMENFKGCKSLEINFSAERTEIAGMNGTGKTTIVDAFCWVLFNQNAAGDAPGSDNFREKPLDENGQTIHNLDTTVELFCTLDGNRFDLKRTQTENWVKKRGNAEATFQGNVSTYWINGVETKKQDFDQRIKAIADGEIMRLVGSLGAFNHLEWKKRREQLLALAGSDVDDRLLAMDEYRPIADQIAERNIQPDELRKVLADQKKAINNELKLLPVRIDEAKKAIPDMTAQEIRDAEYLVADTKKDVAKIDERIIEAKASTDNGARGQMLALEQEIISIKRRVMDEYDAAKRKAKAEADTASENFLRVSADLSKAKRDFEAVESNLKAATEKRDLLREKYMECKRTPVRVDSICPTCGQPLPETKVEATRERAEVQKREALMQIQTEGKAAAERVAEFEKDAQYTEQQIADLELRVEAAKAARETALFAVASMPDQPDFSGEKRLLEASTQLDELQAAKGGNADDKVRELMARKEELLAIIDRNAAILAKRDAGVEAEQRIKGYESRQRELGAQLAETEMLIVLIERFVQARCGALEDSINSHFPTVRWKLFDTQINGGIVDACTCMIDCDGALVPFESLNTASRIKANIEIVDVLSNHYDVRMPLFIDGAESVNTMPKIDSQMITLSVSTDAKITVR